MSNQYHYNRTGAERKAFVQAVSDILHQPAVYQKAPTFAYKIGAYTVDRSGNLCCGEDVSEAEIGQLLAKLQELGFAPEGWTDAYIPPSENGTNHLTVDVALCDDFTDIAYLNLQKIIDSKANLLKLALDTDNLEIKVDGKKISFPWFTLHGIDGEALAYSQLVTALVGMAKRQKRVTAKEKPIENAKFDMRLFLVRLGLIGDEYKIARKILLRNLTGNSAWKAGQPPENRAESAITGVTMLPVLTPVETIETETNEKKGGAPYGVQ